MRGRRRPLIEDRNLEIALALGCLAGFAVLLKDATDDRGGKAPWWIRWATFW
jgi:hypothetical protein